MTIGVVISTYNNPRWLEKTLWGYVHQTRQADEIVIADDGSGEATSALVDSFRERLPIKHVWHEDDGFRKNVILNKALMAAESEYLIFTDHDLLPRNDFVATQERYAEKGDFLSGGCLRLPMDISEALTEDDIASGRAFRLDWLHAQGLKRAWKNTKLVQVGWFCRMMNHITPRGATWNGGNASGWREDMLRVNGYDETMRYGSEDRELGERLFNLGVKSKQLCYSVVTLHLDHARPYLDRALMAANIAKRKETRRSGIIETPHGIRQHILENKSEI